MSRPPTRSTPEQPKVGHNERSPGVLRDPRFVRMVKFGVASGIGFLVAEGILILGVAAYYGTLSPSSPLQAASPVIALDILAFGVGVTIAFVINERVTVEDLERGGVDRRANWTVRWFKYQVASLLGNVVIVGVQLALFATISLSPALGSVVGAVVSYPFTYVVSMRFVWKAGPAQGAVATIRER